tara:strand:+ start:49 stop:276 length:228 start_codon:yes stop_codon:yes gene_type:complete
MPNSKAKDRKKAKRKKHLEIRAYKRELKAKRKKEKEELKKAGDPQGLYQRMIKKMGKAKADKIKKYAEGKNDTHA